MFIAASNTFNIPPGLLSAVCYVESNHDIKAIRIDDGGSSSFGICQLKLDTARQMGFRGTGESLRNPKTNIHYSAMYLSSKLLHYDGDVVRSVSAYNSGTYKVTSDGQPINSEYVRKVLRAWAGTR